MSGEPIRESQQDANGAERFVWVFPLKQVTGKAARSSSEDTAYLSAGVYAIVREPESPAQREAVDQRLDQVRSLGVDVVSQRDIENARYEYKLGQWHEQAMAEARRVVRTRIRELKIDAKCQHKAFAFAPDEIDVRADSGEDDLRIVLDMIG